MPENLMQIGARLTPDGMAFELYRVVFGLTCRADTFQGRYDLWPFCKPYDAEEWFVLMDEEEAKEAAAALTEYLAVVPQRTVPSRISFVQDGTGFHLRCNGEPCGPRLYRGSDDKTVWPFNRLPDWPNHKTRADALKACLRLQEYLDGRTSSLAKKANKKPGKSKAKHK